MITMKSDKPTFNLYHNDTFKWTNAGKKYCIHVEQDACAEDPRRGWAEYESVMALFLRSYDIGDKIPDKEPENFWRRLVRENCTKADIDAAIKNDRLPYKIRETADGRFDLIAPNEWTWESLTAEEIVSTLADDGDLTIRECMELMQPYAVWMPVWAYIHGGITISCGERVYPYSDRWDSGQAGWIITLKKNSKAKGESDAEWKARAMKNMTFEVKEYDEYLTGDVYGYTLYEEEGGEWEEIDSCYTFFGADALENGMLENVGCGCLEAYENGTYKTGTATERIVRTFEF